MLNVSDIFVSFWQITTRIFFAKKAHVLFYYPQHFNRTAEGTNPFFDRLLDTCDRHGISYKLIEEPDWGTDKPRNPKAIKGDALFLLIMVLRKVVGLFSKKDFYHKEKNVACLLNGITFGRLRYRYYITISGSMLHLFGALEADGKVYDMQHGVLYKQHPTFFDEHELLRPPYYQQNLHWLMWGRGYEQCFSRGEEALLAGRIHVVGYPLSSSSVETDVIENKDKVVLFSLQFTHDWQPAQLHEAKRVTEEALQRLADKHVRVLLKHHPRYNNAIAIDDWLQKYPFAELTTLSMQQLMPITMLQVTINSTTAFEYAEQGIPSYFIAQQDEVIRGNLFYSEYRYPLYKDLAIDQVVDRLYDGALRMQDAEIVRKWYREFYDDFDEQEFLKVMQ